MPVSVRWQTRRGQAAGGIYVSWRTDGHGWARLGFPDLPIRRMPGPFAAGWQLKAI
jgi:hypothetical protein